MTFENLIKTRHLTIYRMWRDSTYKVDQLAFFFGLSVYNVKKILTKYEKQYRNRTHYDIRETHKLVKNAVINKGIIKPKSCQLCFTGVKKINGHHFDYSQPLNVIWLCNSCHAKIHNPGNNPVLIDMLNLLIQNNIN